MIIAVDFDGTLCESAWPNIGKPNRKLIKHLISLREEGNLVILWTNREESRLNEAVQWCDKYGLVFDAINDNIPEITERFGRNTRKVYADLYIDDKNAVDAFIKKYHIPYKEVQSVLESKFK
jgi:hypothetical protein